MRALAASFMLSVCALFGAVPQAMVNPVPVRLSIIDGTDIRFTHLSTANELSQTGIYRIVQDNQGFMWFATRYGLYRYDGYGFKVFAHDPDKPNSLSGAQVNTIFKDRDGTLWVSGAQFLDKLNAAAEAFTRYPVPDVRHISQDRSGILWLASATAGLCSLDPATEQIRHYSSDPHDPSSLSSNGVIYTGEDKEGRFWVANDGYLDELDRRTGRAIQHIPLTEAPFGFGFYEDRLSIFWIFHVSPNSLTAFDRKTNTLTHYALPESQPPGTAVTRITAILEDHTGALWIATHGSGLLRYDRDHRRFIRYRNDPADPDSLPQNEVDALFEDREGGIWVGLGSMGVVRFTTNAPPFKRLPHAPASRVEPFVGAIYEDRQRAVWVGTPQALNRIDRKAGTLTSYRRGAPAASTDVITLRDDHAGNLWVGTYGHGLLRFDPRTGRFVPYLHDPADPHSLSNDFVTRLLVDHSGTLWVGTKSGLNRFDAVTQRFTTYKLGPRDSNAVYLELVEDREGALWLGTEFSGLQRFDPATGKVEIYRHDINRPRTLSDDRVNSAYFDHSGTMWVGTQNGLNKFDPKSGTFTVYTRRDGLPGNAVACVLDDDRGNLWMSTNNGVARFDPKRRTFSNYSTTDGLSGPNLTGWGACFKSPTGEMFFGGFSGATAFFPDKVAYASYIPPIVLTDFRLFGNPVEIGSRSPLQRSISYARDLILTREQNVFSLSFAALSYTNPSTNRYRYKLEPLEPNWNEAGSDRRQVTYTTLPAGKYTFRAQGATSTGAWSEPGASVRIEIPPPFWGTWWFQSACGIFMLVSLWFAHRLRLQQIARQFNVRLNERIGERERIARELHDTLLQGVQGLMWRFQAAAAQIPVGEPARQLMESALDRADEVIVEGRDRVKGLRTAEEKHRDLSETFAMMSAELAQENAIPFRIVLQGTPRDLNPIVCDDACHIGREALINAFRHSLGQKIETEITFARTELRLRFRDDGCGVDSKILEQGGRPEHWGMTGMRERARNIGARLDIWSRPGAGTEVDLRIPASSAYRGGAKGWRWPWSGYPDREGNNS